MPPSAATPPHLPSQPTQPLVSQTPAGPSRGGGRKVGPLSRSLHAAGSTTQSPAGVGNQHSPHLPALCLPRGPIPPSCTSPQPRAAVFGASTAASGRQALPLPAARRWHGPAAFRLRRAAGVIGIPAAGRRRGSRLAEVSAPPEQGQPMTQRALSVLVVASAALIVYFVIRTVRLRRRNRKTRRYGVLDTNIENMELTPLEQDDGDDDTTVFDASHPRRFVYRSQMYF
uniref:Transmembrane protein 157 n=1 Tax=Otus sunia TaxID=257818 RepID=A0A8C8AY98_9STRI